MIEKIVLNHLKRAIEIPVYMEIPPKMPESFVIVQKTGSGRTDFVDSAMFAIQSYADSLCKAAELNESVKEAMDELLEDPRVSRVSLNSDYNYTNTQIKKYRYQAVYDLVYKE